MENYKLKSKSYYKQTYFKNESYRLFNSAWNYYRFALKNGIDKPIEDSDICDFLENAINEKVNNPNSTFYIYGI